MRVLQLIPTLWIGGAERVVGTLARRLRGAGHDVGVVSLFGRSASWIEADLEAAGVELRFLDKRPGLDPRMIPRIARAVAAFRPDVIHSHLYVLKYALPAIVAARRCPVVHTIHNLAEREVEAPSRAIQYVAFRAGVVPVAIGEAVAESVRRVYGLRACRVVPNGIPVSDFAAAPGARDAVRAELGLPASAPVFLAVGRFDPQKDHPTLVRAFASPHLRDTGAHLLLAGSGGLRGQAERIARELGAADRIHFLGVRRDVPRLLAAADAFVLASRWEGNPLSVMEAMASGKPVVATAVGCVPELVPDSAVSLVAPGDPEALAAAMRALAVDLPRARRKGSAAAELARTRFDADGMTRAYETLYAEVA
jgi:glycosyltransferase involved in cell wall biosynthesis